MQIWPGWHCEFVLQPAPLPACTVTLTVTTLPPASDCTVMGKDGSGEVVVRRTPCASPPGPLRISQLEFFEPQLAVESNQLEATAWGRVKLILSP